MQPVAGADAAEHGGDERLRAAVLEQQDDPGVAGEVRLDGLERASQRGGLPRPRRPDRRPEQRLQREQRRRLAPERPARPEVRRPEPLLAEARRRLAEDEADPRVRGGAWRRRRGRRPAAARGPRRPAPRGRPGVITRITAFGEPSARLRRSVPNLRVQRPQRRALEPLHERPNLAVAVLEREPRVALPPALGDRGADRAAGDPERWASGAPPSAEPARGQDGVQERQPQRRTRPARRGGRPRSGRGSPRGRRAGGRCAGRGSRRSGPRRRRAPGNGRAACVRTCRRADVSRRPLAVGRAGLHDLVLRSVLLVAAELAAVVEPDRLAALPLGLVDRQGSAARAAASSRTAP